jgi:UDP-N-acetyl-D-glucosamine dehydrogenase
VRRADAVIVLVDHDDFDLTMVGREGRYVLDTRRCVTGPNVDTL